MVYDPITNTTITTSLTGDPTQDGASASAEKARLANMVATANSLIGHDQVIASPYGMMAPASLRSLAESANIRHQAFDDLELRKLMVYIDTMAVAEGRRPYAVAEVQRQQHSVPVAMIKIPSLPRSRANEWEVLETHNKVCIPGGVYTWRKGLIIKLADMDEAQLRAVVAQGVKLKAHPEEIARITCPECDTSWPSDLPNGDECPMCYLEHQHEERNRKRQIEADMGPPSPPVESVVVPPVEPTVLVDAPVEVDPVDVVADAPVDPITTEAAASTTGTESAQPTGRGGRKKGG